MDLSEIFRAVFPGFKARAHGYGFSWGVILYSSRVLQGQSRETIIMQRIASSAAIVVLAAGLAAPAAYRAFTQAPIPAHIVGQVVNFDVPPTVIQGRVLVPLRGIFERLGAIWTTTPGRRIPWHCTVSKGQLKMNDVEGHA